MIEIRRHDAHFGRNGTADAKPVEDERAQERQRQDDIDKRESGGRSPGRGAKGKRHRRARQGWLEPIRRNSSALRQCVPEFADRRPEARSRGACRPGIKMKGFGHAHGQVRRNLGEGSPGEGRAADRRPTLPQDESPADEMIAWRTPQNAQSGPYAALDLIGVTSGSFPPGTPRAETKIHSWEGSAAGPARHG